jgi:hypothetical protein
MENQFLEGMPTMELGIVKKLNVHAFLVNPPNPKGGYRIGEELQYSVQFNIEHKPNWIQRFFMRKFFGLYWFDKEE